MFFFLLSELYYIFYILSADVEPIFMEMLLINHHFIIIIIIIIIITSDTGKLK